VADERGGAERVLDAVDSVRGLSGGIVVVVIAVASFSAGGCLLGLLGVDGVLAVRRRRA
jgi:hypothetical protein